MNKPSLFLFFGIDYIFKSTNFTKMLDHLYFTHLCGCEGEESWVPEITITSCPTKHLLVSAFILSYLQAGSVKTRRSLNYNPPPPLSLNCLLSQAAYSLPGLYFWGYTPQQSERQLRGQTLNAPGKSRTLKTHHFYFIIPQPHLAAAITPTNTHTPTHISSNQSSQFFSES